MQVAHRKVDELAVPAGRADRRAVELLQRRIEGLQRRDRRDRGRRDGVTHGALAEEPHERVHLGKLGHQPIVSPTGDIVTRPVSTAS